MFFTAELLSRRDSGFGLLWLAATLGPKSSFKKLPRRSVMTADISELCNLIAEPAEPLALRLSSNLMVGAVRVFKVKQEILLADATTCFNTLKKAVQDMHSLASATAQLQMGQPTVRPDTVTAATDPTIAFALDFDHLFGGWDEPRSQVIREEREEESDEEYNPTGAGQRKRGRKKASSVSLAEQGRADLHTLQEDHSYFLSSSLDDPFQDAGGMGPSSSQFGGFRFDDNFLEGVDLGEELGAELARELGEGWIASPNRHASGSPLNPVEARDADITAPIYDGLDFVFQDRDGHDILDGDIRMEDDFSTGIGSAQDLTRKPGAHANRVEGLDPEGSIILPLSPLGTQAVQDGDETQPKGTRKPKRVRLLLDARTELTNEELERARANYLEGQTHLRREMDQKRAEKQSAKIIEEMIWGAPRGVEAPVLVDFWQENFRIQVQAQSGRLHLITEGEPPRKRQKTDKDTATVNVGETAETYDWDRPLEDLNPDPGAGIGYGHADLNLDSRMRSSEEPGQGRRASRAPSLIGSQFELGIAPLHEFPSGSQRSNVFPWDNAGASSSISGAIPFGGGGSDRQSFGRADSRLRGSSLGRDSIAGGVPESPASFGFTTSHRDNAFDFDVPADDPAADSQLSDASVMTLERNSYNFLEFAKVQLNAFPSADSTLKFDNVVPVETSTRHVASAAFYHCLVLATKNLLSVKQQEPYGTVEISIR